MKNRSLENPSLDGALAGALAGIRTSPDCIEDWLWAARPAPQHFSYAMILDIPGLARYHRDLEFRMRVQGADVVLGAGRPTAWLVQQLYGVRLPIRSAAAVARGMLEMSRPSDRIVWIGAAPGMHRPMRIHPGPGASGLRRCVEFIEAHSPFRFCLLAVNRPELIAQTLHNRGRARGLALAVGPLNE
jgi:hypothetical protein